LDKKVAGNARRSWDLRCEQWRRNLKRLRRPVEWRGESLW